MSVEVVSGAIRPRSGAVGSGVDVLPVAEMGRFGGHLASLVRASAPPLGAQPGIGVQSAVQLPAVAGDNPQRLRTEGSFAHLCGAAPLPASSGTCVDRHRHHTGGVRDASCALQMIALNPLSRCAPTCGYAHERAPAGKADLDVLRRFKRYIAREVGNILTEGVSDLAPERAVRHVEELGRVTTWSSCRSAPSRITAAPVTFGPERCGATRRGRQVRRAARRGKRRHVACETRSGRRRPTHAGDSGPDAGSAAFRVSGAGQVGSWRARSGRRPSRSSEEVPAGRHAPQRRGEVAGVGLLMEGLPTWEGRA